MEAYEIQAIREKLRLTQAQFGQLLGVHSMTVSKWERGIAHPTAYQKALIQQFGVAAEKKKIQNQDISGLLVGLGIIAVLYLLLKESQRD